jgi:hypothetical protein
LNDDKRAKAIVTRSRKDKIQGVDRNFR